MVNIQQHESPPDLQGGGATAVGRRGLSVDSTWLQRLSRWTSRVKLERKLTVALLVAAVTSGVTTFGAMTGNLPTLFDPRSILVLIILDLALLLGLAILIARRLVILWGARRRGAAGARLHARLVVLFGVFAVAPTIIVALFSIILFNFGLQGWFSDQVRTAITESLAVAEAYHEEHRQTITADALAMAQDLNRSSLVLMPNPQRFNQYVAAQASIRSLSEAVVFDRSGRILARGGFSILLDFDPRVPAWAFERADGNDVVILTPETDDRVRALVRLEAYPDSYLYIGRLVDPRVVGHVNDTRAAAQVYEELEGKRADLQISFALIFAVVALLLLFAAIWGGLDFATYLSRPIGQLISASDRVAAGDLSSRVAVGDSRDEIASLSLSFNRMTSKLQSQQRALLEANKQIDSRRRFIEAVLSGVSSGVIGLDAEGRVTHSNRIACELLSTTAEAMDGRHLGQVQPELTELLARARRKPGRIAEGQIKLAPEQGTSRTLFARVSAEFERRKVIGFVLTFDDITELLSVQRKAAWADVARRIAHEIKNPLTPIQLSAERLRRKYLVQIDKDPETFETCTDTIVRHVEDIGRMVDEFSSFARMPAPVMEETNLVELIEQALFLQRNAHPGIRFELEAAGPAAVALCDGQQISRAVTNLLQNAVDAVAERQDSEGEAAPSGRILVRLVDRPGERAILVEDNGAGLPKAERDRLTEPYVTTRQKGTGLGLAIVHKIMEDHGAALRFEDMPDGGARVGLIFSDTEEGPVSGDEQDKTAAEVSAHGA